MSTDNTMNLERFKYVHKNNLGGFNNEQRKYCIICNPVL